MSLRRGLAAVLRQGQSYPLLESQRQCSGRRGPLRDASLLAVGLWRTMVPQKPVRYLRLCFWWTHQVTLFDSRCSLSSSLMSVYRLFYSSVFFYATLSRESCEIGKRWIEIVIRKLSLLLFFFFSLVLFLSFPLLLPLFSLFPSLLFLSLSLWQQPKMGHSSWWISMGFFFSYFGIVLLYMYFVIC